MGISPSREWAIDLSKLGSNTKQFVVGIIGLDAAGKTTLLHSISSKLLGGAKVKELLAIGFNVQRWTSWQHLSLASLDVGGDRRLVLENRFIENCDALIFVVDAREAGNAIRNPRSGDRHPRSDFEHVMQRETRGLPVLVMANKSDLPGACTVEELQEALCLARLQRQWFVVPTCAVTLDGVQPGLEWLARAATSHYALRLAQT